jgi:hypothetical protein
VFLPLVSTEAEQALGSANATHCHDYYQGVADKKVHWSGLHASALMPSRQLPGWVKAPSAVGFLAQRTPRFSLHKRFSHGHDNPVDREHL